MGNDLVSEPEQLLGLARKGDPGALGQLLELYRSYLSLLARLQICGRLNGKVGASDAVQEAFLEAYRAFDGFHGTTEAELLIWLRRILASKLANLVRRYYGTQRRDIRLEHQLESQLQQSSQALDQGLLAPQSSPGIRPSRQFNTTRRVALYWRSPACSTLD